MPSIDRRESDTPRSYAALCDYCALGPHRSIDKLLQSYDSPIIENPPTRARVTLGYWSKKDDWVERANAYDAHVQAEAEAARSAIRTQRRAELEDRDWIEGSALRESVQALLAEMPRFIRHTESEVRQNGELVKVITLALRAGPGELARALKLASEIQRLSVGEPTEIHKLLESEIGAFLDTLQSQLDEETYARIVAIIAGGRAAQA